MRLSPAPDGVNEGVFEELFGDRPRTFDDYRDMVEHLRDEATCPIYKIDFLSEIKNVVNQPDIPPFFHVANLATKNSHLAFGHDTDMRPLVMKINLGMKEDASEQRFFRERSLLAELRSHPLWVKTLPEYGLYKDGMVMECLLPGMSLADLVARYPNIIDANPTLTAMILKQAAQGLMPLHEQGIIHRDLKLENIFLLKPDTEDHIVKLIDPGAAKFSQMRDLTCPGLCVGSNGFMAPEQLRRLPLDPRTDVYGLGCIGYNLLTKASVNDDQIKNPNRPVDKALLNGQPKVLAELILRMLATNSADRPSNTGVLIA